MVYYSKPMHRQQAFADLNYSDEEFRVTIELCDTVLSLPMHPYLKQEEMDVVVDAIRVFFKAR